MGAGSNSGYKVEAEGSKGQQDPVRGESDYKCQEGMRDTDFSYHSLQ